MASAGVQRHTGAVSVTSAGARRRQPDRRNAAPVLQRQRLHRSSGGSLITIRATSLTARDGDRVATNVFTFRGSQSIFGDGYGKRSATARCSRRRGTATGMRGQIINVPVLEAPDNTRIGRFGWKGQQASLISFSADAYLNEMGITSPLHQQRQLTATRFR